MTQTDIQVTYTRDEVVAEIERGARRRLGLSAEEFAHAYRTRQIADRSAVIDLLAWLFLLRDDDPIFAHR